MDWSALGLSVLLAVWVVAILIPLALVIAHVMAFRRFRGRRLCEVVIALPLVLPPTVLGFYLLAAFKFDGPVGMVWRSLTGSALAFSFEGLVAAALVFNLPFAVLPIVRAFEAIPRAVRDAAWTCGMGPWTCLWRVEIPLAWPGLLSALVLTFTHTLGEFGAVLMVGGAIPAETKTLSIAIYDRVQAFDDSGAVWMSLMLMAISFVAVGIVSLASQGRVSARSGNSRGI